MRTLLQINTVINSGSTGRIAEEIGQLALSKGWRSVIAYGRNPRPSKSETIRIGSDWDVRWHGVETRLFDRHGLASRNATKKFIEQIKELKPDIIHLHNIHGYYLNYRLLFDYLSSIETPLVWTLHDCWPMTGHCSHFTFVECDKWKNGCYSCPQTKEYPASCLIDRCENNWKDKRNSFTKLKNLIVVPVSDWLEAIVKESFLHKYPTKRIYNGVDLTVFTPQSVLRENSKVRLLGVAGVWARRKGLYDFISLREKLPMDQFEIVLVGLSSKQIQSLPNGITGIARTESVQELAKLYSGSSIFVNPTWEDNFPTTNLEALACGTPVVTYRTGGSIEAVSPETGIIVEQGDIDGLVSAIAELTLRDQKQLSIDCRKRAKALYDKNKRFEEYINLYNNLQ